MERSGESATFYIPLIRRTNWKAMRILDVGCGNGISVDVLRNAGFEAWGIDLSQLRRRQWRERASAEFLVVASALRLPFADSYFDVVIRSGVIEHIGVVETPAPNYAVSALPDQRSLRTQFLRELGRVTRPEGRIFLDAPHGLFPIDFWHGNSPGAPRVHSIGEAYLPSFREIRELSSEALGASSVRPHSPRNRLQFRQSANHLHGRLLRIPASIFFRVMEWRPFRWLAATPLNPYLVVEIEKRGRGGSAPL